MVGEKPCFFDFSKAFPESFTVAEDFFGGRFERASGAEIFLKEFVVCGDDVLDFGTVLGLLDGESVNENSLIWNSCGHSFELCQMACRSVQFLQDGNGLEAGKIELWQWEHGHERYLANSRHIGGNMHRKLSFLCMLCEFAQKKPISSHDAKGFDPSCLKIPASRKIIRIHVEDDGDVFGEGGLNLIGLSDRAKRSL